MDSTDPSSPFLDMGGFAGFLLVAAVRGKGNKDLLIKALDEGIDVNFSFDKGGTALNILCSSDSAYRKPKKAELVKFLLE